MLLLMPAMLVAIFAIRHAELPIFAMLMPSCFAYAAAFTTAAAAAAAALTLRC